VACRAGTSRARACRQVTGVCVVDLFGGAVLAISSKLMDNTGINASGRVWSREKPVFRGSRWLK
jgi:hypothetical protein